MVYKIKAGQLSVPLKVKADPAADTILGVLGTDLLEKVADAAVAGWWEMKLATPGVVGRQGFMQSDKLEQTAAPVPPSFIDEKTFFEAITTAALKFATNREYLYALAVAETEVKNIKSKSSEAFGPFQFMPATWKGMVTKYGAAEQIDDADIVLPASQAIFAALAVRDATVALQAAVGHTPAYTELYMAHLLGEQAAAAVLSAPKDQGIDVALREFYKNTLGNDFVNKILAANPGLLLEGGSVRTAAQVLAEMAKRLEPAFATANAVVAKYDPAVTGPGGGNPAPWMAPAEAELAKNIKETGSNPEILKYFKATEFNNVTSDSTAWCAAFVSWCMAESGNAEVVAANKRTAWAPTWAQWGRNIAQPRYGAVALVLPMPDGKAGHMGFVAGGDAKKVVLLSGNFGDCLCKADFLAKDIIDYRWLDITDSVVAIDPAVLASAPADIRGTLDKAQNVFTALIKAGWSKPQALGIVANIRGESNFDFQDTTGDGGKSHGLCQWDKNRRADFDKKFLHKTFAESTFDEQVAFITFEMNNTEIEAGKALRLATTASESADIVVRKYERSGDQDGDSIKRQAWAEAYALVLR